MTIKLGLHIELEPEGSLTGHWRGGGGQCGGHSEHVQTPDSHVFVVRFGTLVVRYMQVKVISTTFQQQIKIYYGKGHYNIAL